MYYKILNTAINISTEEEYISKIFETLKNNQKKIFFYLNSYSFYLFNKNIAFKNAFLKADYVIPDGYSIVWANQLLNNILIDKVVFTYSYINRLAKLFEDFQIKVFYLGGKIDTINKFIDKTRLNYPKQLIVGYNFGHFDFEMTNDIVEKINKSGAQILIVGMGMPRSEIWISSIIDKLNVNCVFSVGGFFEFLAGNKKQAPGFLYNSGFEWLYRLIQEPRRLFKRYFIANTYFVFRLIYCLLNKKFSLKKLIEK